MPIEDDPVLVRALSLASAHGRRYQLPPRPARSRLHHGTVATLVAAPCVRALVSSITTLEGEMNSKMKAVALCAAALAAACSDATQPVGPAVQSPGGPASATRTTGGENYVAIGTSISMGWASNGVYAGSQKFAFPELLRFRGQCPISLPLIEAPGCYSPLVAPLGANLRLSGEGFAGSVACAPNKPGVQLPTQDLGMAGATAL